MLQGFVQCCLGIVEIQVQLAGGVEIGVVGEVEVMCFEVGGWLGKVEFVDVDLGQIGCFDMVYFCFVFFVDCGI